MRPHLWCFDTVTVDLEDRDVCVKAVHKITLTTIIVDFRLTKAQLKGEPEELRRSIERLATDRLLDLASFLDNLP